MPAYKSSISIEAPLDDVFGFVTDAHNLPRFVEGMTGAEPTGGDRVRISVQTPGGDAITGEGWFRVHSGHRHRVEWGMETPDGYHGWLEVDREGHVCSVTLEVHVAGDGDPAIDRAVDATLFALKEAMESRPSR